MLYCDEMKHQEVKKEALVLTGVPLDIQKDLLAFMRSVYDIKFFQPDGNPDPKWHLIKGETPVAAFRNTWQHVVDKFGPGVFEDRFTFGTPDYVPRPFLGIEFGLYSLGKIEKIQNAIKFTKVLRDSGRDAAYESIMAALSEVLNKAAMPGCPMNGLVPAACSVAYAILTSDLDFPDKEKIASNARSSWEVWQKGYGFFGFVDGQIYVYSGSRLPSSKEIKGLRREAEEAGRIIDARDGGY